MTRAEIHAGIERLRRMCDPRGHELLDTIEDVLVAQADAHHLLEAQLRWETLEDTLDHSKQADLRVVS